MSSQKENSNCQPICLYLLTPNGGYSLYQADPAIFYSDEDRSLGLNAVNRQTRIDALIRHPLNVTVEYPETGKVMNQSIGHIFPVCDPQNFFEPKAKYPVLIG